MLEGQDVPAPSPTAGVLKLVPVRTEGAQWREAQTVYAMRELLAVYRRSMVELATENTMLREQIAVLRLLATPGGASELAAPQAGA